MGQKNELICLNREQSYSIYVAVQNHILYQVIHWLEQTVRLDLMVLFHVRCTYVFAALQM